MDLLLRERGVFVFGQFRLDPLRRTLLHRGTPVTVTARLFDTLLYFVQNAERLLGRDELEQAIWRGRLVGGSNLQKAISALRKLLQDNDPGGTYIVTVPGRGLRLAVPVTLEETHGLGASSPDMFRIAAPRLAKLSPPRLPPTIARPRLFALLDTVLERKIAWVTGPPGAGKTTLVCSYIECARIPCIWYTVDSGDADPASFFFYMREAALAFSPGCDPLPLLTAEYLPDLPGFTRRFFRGLIERLPQRAALVLDNFQEAPERSPFGTILRDAAGELCIGATLIVMSRQEPPAILARLRANQDMAMLGWSDLRLTEAEVQEIVVQHAPMLASAAAALHSRSGGWAAGLTLLLETWVGEGAGPNTTANAPPQAVFDYFITELFESVTAEIRQVWLVTAYQQDFTAHSATVLSGDENAGRLLDTLVQRRLFIDKYASDPARYRYHALFREFLIAHIERHFSATALNALLKQSTEVAEQSGDIDTALGLHERMGDGDAGIRVLLAHAPTLFAQGRWQTLLHWLQRQPQDRVEQMPWIAYWRGACHGQTDIPTGQMMMERAYRQFVQADDVPGQAMSACAVIESILLQYGDFKGIEAWVGLLEGMIRRAVELPSPAMNLRLYAVFLGAVTYCFPQHELKSLAQRHVVHLCGRDDIGAGERLMAASSLVLSLAWYSGSGEAKAAIDAFEPLLLRHETTALQRSTWFYAKTFVLCDSGDLAGWAACSRMGERIATDNGLVVLGSWWANLAVWQALSLGRLAEAEIALPKMQAAAKQQGFVAVTHVHLSCAWLALLQSKPSLARNHTEASLALMRAHCTSTRLPVTLVFHAHALAACGHTETAIAAAQEAHAWFGNAPECVLRQDALLAEANARLAAGQREEALPALAEAFAIGRRGAHFHTTPWLPKIMARLCNVALREDIETAYVKELMAKRHLPTETA